MTINNKTEYTPVRVAVVGHTNTGKTSLLRTLLRDNRFGEVSNRPSTTRHVEASELLIDGHHFVTLIDTPGLEDSMGLLDELDRDAPMRQPGIERIQDFLLHELSEQDYAQEAKVLRQLLSCDIAIYVIDAREAVMQKYKDELSILSYSTKPVIPILNFVASDNSHQQDWQEHVKKLNLHALVSFDTVAYSRESELSLWQSMQVLLPEKRQLFVDVIAGRDKEWQGLKDSATEIIAELLIDVAAYRKKAADEHEALEVMETMRAAVREREQKASDAILDLYRFFNEDVDRQELDVTQGVMDVDLFDAKALVAFGIETGSAMATGAAIGFSIDLFTGGLSLGAATLLGAAAGAVFKHGKGVVDQVRGYQTLRIDDATLTLLGMRQAQLINQLQRRGHAAQQSINIEQLQIQLWAVDQLPKILKSARRQKAWSKLNSRFNGASDRRRAIAELCESIDL